MRGRRGCGRGNSYHSHINNLNNKNKGLFSALGQHIFDYGKEGAADQMRTTWEKIANHIGTIYGHNISNDFQNKKRIEIPQPKHTLQVNDKHRNIFEQIKYQHSRLMQAREFKLQFLEAEVQRQEDPEAPVK